MRERFTDTEEMAKQAGLLHEKRFRSRLRKNLPQHHVKGSWPTRIGSDENHAMRRELKEMLAGKV